MSSSTSRKRITVIASSEGIKKAEGSLKRLGFESKSGFAKSQVISRSAVTKFFNRDPIQPDTFKRICTSLKLEWVEILEPDSTVELLKQNRVGQPDTPEEGAFTVTQQESMQVVVRQLTVINKQNEVETVITLEGDIASIDAKFRSTLEVLLRNYAGCTIQVTDIQAGSIKITIKGTQQGIERLIKQFAAGDLTDIDGFLVKNIHLLDERLLEELENSNSKDKWNVIQEILKNPKKGRKLQNVDLSDADLSGADLSDADLSGADLSGADLSDADLSGADLSDADLSGADLSGADLSDADLSGANLNGTNLSGTNLSKADLSNVNLNGANLVGAILVGAILLSVSLLSPSLRRAIISGAMIILGRKSAESSEETLEKSERR